MKLASGVLAAALIVAGATSASAQNWMFDARRIGMGAATGAQSIASKMIQDERDYRVIVLPFGLLQVLRNLDVFKPSSDSFDLVRSIEYAAAPIHYVVGRDAETDTGRQLVVDVRNGTLSRDLNAYRGFVPVNQPTAEGLAAPNWGGTIKVHRGVAGAFQGIYVGAGPYLAMRDSVNVDERLLQILGSSTNVYLPNTDFHLGNAARGEGALAVTVGYRGRYPLPVSQSDRDGLYVAANYNYLHGFVYDNADTALALSTDQNGLLTIRPGAASPVVITRENATSGAGFSMDVGVGAIVDRWEVGFGLTGVANRITWTDVQRSTYVLGNLFAGNGNFVQSPPVGVPDVRVELPVDARVNGGYRGDSWATLADFGHGFQGTSFHGGVERRLGGIAVRGGGFYAREMWEPTVGVGFGMRSHVGLDVALFGNATNVERVRKAAIAVSLRINRE